MYSCTHCLRPRNSPLPPAIGLIYRALLVNHTEYTELKPLLSGVHSVMRVKSVLAGEGGGCTPPPLITFTLTSKVAVYAPAEWADTLTLFHLFQYMYSVVNQDRRHLLVTRWE
jgi:hypothetical protein